MVFSNTVFLFLFLPIVFVLYIVIPKTTIKNIMLTAVSIIFYAYGEPFAVFLMIASVCMNYVFGLLMKKKNRFRKLVLIISVIANIAVLGIFKYADFAVDIVNQILPFDIPSPNIALPIGISFFTFQAMSYVIDVYREPDIIQKSLYKLLFYISFFPQLIAGPIVKYHDFEKQISEREVTPLRTAQGIRRFIFGLAKKLLVANQMAIAADSVFALDNELLSVPTAWLGAIAYTLQIYFDFSGYSDMAIGLGKMFGFDFKENFNYPYISSSVTEFWRRWHISVSTWFKEYLYIPLGGNRKGRGRTVINKLIVFFCTGLWHGASATFVIWGLLNGLMLMIESAIGLAGKPKKVIGNIYTMLFTVTAFVIFRADSLGQSVDFIAAMFTGFDVTTQSLAVALRPITPVFITALVAGIIFSAPIKGFFEQKFSAGKYSSAAEGLSYLISLGLLILCIINLSSSTYNPFIYFRF